LPHYLDTVPVLDSDAVASADPARAWPGSRGRAAVTAWLRLVIE
jgi:hypothetical protein